MKKILTTLLGILTAYQIGYADGKVKGLDDPTEAIKRDSQGNAFVISPRVDTVWLAEKSKKDTTNNVNDIQNISKGDGVAKSEYEPKTLEDSLIGVHTSRVFKADDKTYIRISENTSTDLETYWLSKNPQLEKKVGTPLITQEEKSETKKEIPKITQVEQTKPNVPKKTLESKVNLIATKVTKQDKTYLESFKWKPYPGTEITPLMESWETAKTLTSAVIKTNGPLKAEGMGAYLGNKNIGAHFEIGNLDKIIKQFEATNPLLKKKLLKQYLDTLANVSDLNLRDVFRNYIADGDLKEWEFNELMNGLNKSLVFGYYYIANNRQASLPGILVISPRKEKYVEEKSFTIYKGKELEKVEEDTSVIGYKLPKKEPEKQRDKLKDKKYNLEVLAGVGYINDEDVLVPNVGVGIYPNDIFVLRLILGYSTKDKNLGRLVIQTPEDLVTGWYGYGTIDKTRNTKYFDALLEGSLEIGSGVWGSLGIGAGFDFKTNEEKVYESLRKGDEILAENYNTYGNTKTRTNFKATVGPDFKFKNVRLMPRAGVRGKNTYYGINGSISF